MHDPSVMRGAGVAFLPLLALDAAAKPRNISQIRTFRVAQKHWPS